MSILTMADRPSLLDRVKDQRLRRSPASLSSSSFSSLGGQISIPQDSLNNPIPSLLPSRIPSLQSLTRKAGIEATFGTKFKNMETGEDKDIDDFYQLRNSLETLDINDLGFLHIKNPKDVRRKPRIAPIANNVERIMQDLFGANAPIMENELHLFEFGHRRCFWAVIVGSIMFIVKGSRWRVWLGPVQRFSEVLIAHPQKQPQLVSHVLKETDEEQSGKSQDKNRAPSKQVNQKEHYKGKRKARTSYSKKAPSKNTPSEDFSSDSETHKSLKKTRQERDENPGHNFETRRLGVQKRISRKETEIRSIKEESSAQKVFVISSDDDDDDDDSGRWVGGNVRASQQVSQFKSLHEIRIPALGLSRCDLSQEKLDKTKFDISISTNDIGPVRHSLRSCQTMKDLYLTGLKDWGMLDQEKEVKAMRVRFKWMPQDDEGTVLVKEAPESFDEMLNTIDSAPCWDQGGDKLCVVRVHIIMV